MRSSRADAVDPSTPIRLAELIHALHGVDATDEPWTGLRGRLDASDSTRRAGTRRAPGNLLFTGGELTGVIDWGCAGVGDPAGDLMTAWLFLDERGRLAFQRELPFDDATWARARGWALHLAVLALPYYRGRYALPTAIAQHTLDQLEAC